MAWPKSAQGHIAGAWASKSGCTSGVARWLSVLGDSHLSGWVASSRWSQSGDASLYSENDPNNRCYNDSISLINNT
eukprot:2763100-Amphidinium_carterae.1